MSLNVTTPFAVTKFLPSVARYAVLDACDRFYDDHLELLRFVGRKGSGVPVFDFPFDTVLMTGLDSPETSELIRENSFLINDHRMRSLALMTSDDEAFVKRELDVSFQANAMKQYVVVNRFLREKYLRSLLWSQNSVSIPSRSSASYLNASMPVRWQRLEDGVVDEDGHILYSKVLFSPALDVDLLHAVVASSVNSDDMLSSFFDDSLFMGDDLLRYVLGFMLGSGKSMYAERLFLLSSALDDVEARLVVMSYALRLVDGDFSFFENVNFMFDRDLDSFFRFVGGSPVGIDALFKREVVVDSLMDVSLGGRFEEMFGSDVRYLGD